VSDFHQGGEITTLHQLGPADRPRLEEDLRGFAADRPLALILSAQAPDLEGGALPRMVEELSGAGYVREVVVALGQASRKDLEKAKELFAVLPQPVSVFLAEGRAMARLLSELKDQGIFLGQEGKGRAMWLALGVVLARGVSRCVALQGCDIADYDRLLLGRLVYPLLSPRLNYQFSKGYYARLTHRLYGRVTRLFVTPLLQALISLAGPMPYLNFLNCFRYLLAGECALDLDLARISRLPADGGLEVGILGEAYRHLSPKRICQVDLAQNYEHAHQELSPEDPGKGLPKMCTDIGHTILRTLAAEGAVLSPGLLRSLEVAYIRRAEEIIESYAADAAINGLVFDRHQEGLSVEAFGQGLRQAIARFSDDPRGQGLLSNWNQVMSAVPDFSHRLAAAVEADSV
jgi:glucosyl-3-phosphoglycerate synthase